MPRDPWFPFFPFDYLSDPVVLCMSLEEQGAYVRLLCHAWHPPVWGGKACQKGYLPNDATLLTAMSGARDPSHWEAMSEAILRAFNVTDDGTFIFQKRMVSEAGHVDRIRAARMEGGRRGVQIREDRKVTLRSPYTDHDGGLKDTLCNHTVTVTKDHSPTENAGLPSGPIQKPLEFNPPSPEDPSDMKQTDAIWAVFSAWRSSYPEHANADLAGARPSMIKRAIANRRKALGCTRRVAVEAVISAMAQAQNDDWLAGRQRDGVVKTELTAILEVTALERLCRMAAGTEPDHRGPGPLSLAPRAESFEEARKRKIREEEAKRPDLQPFVPPVRDEG
jgi:uncharacterized protein YdaU (DUF1376 family)